MSKRKSTNQLMRNNVARASISLRLAMGLFCAALLSSCADMDAGTVEVNEAQQAIGDFWRSCSSIQLKNQCDRNSYGNLGALCRREDGSINGEAWWNLDNELGNEDGHLVPGSKGFSNSCEKIRLIGAIPLLRADCSSQSGALIANEFPLNVCIANRNGDLHWVCGSAIEGRNLCPRDTPSGWERGRVSWINAAKGFGYIATSTGPAFVHLGCVGDVFRSLRDDMEVWVTSSWTAKGHQITGVSLTAP